MFYATRIKSLEGNVAIDENGRILRFIGYLPVRVGDTVYTDGRIIFGNAPPKGGAEIIDEPSGIPVLGDEYLLSQNDAELRGYIDNRGKYRIYKIAGEDWITNSKKFFAHGSAEFKGKKIIDADFSDTNAKFIVTDGIYKKSLVRNLYYPVMIPRRNYLDDVYTWKEVEDTNYYHFAHWVFSLYPKLYPLILGSETFGNSNVPVQIFKDEMLKEEIDLKTYAEDIERRALQCAEEIVDKSYDFEESVPYVSWQEINETNDAFYQYQYGENARLPEGAVTRPETFIAHTFVHVLTSNTSDENFSGTVFASTYGYCFPYIQSRFNYRVQTDPEHVLTRSTRAIREWKSVPFGASAIYLISNGELEDIISFRKFGGIISELSVADGKLAFILGTTTDTFIRLHCYINGFDTVNVPRHVKLLPDNTEPDESEQEDPEKVEPKTLIPVGSGFYHMDKFGRLTFYNSKEEKIAENIPVNDNFLHVEMNYGVFWAEQERYSDLRRKDSHNRFAFGDKPDEITCKIYKSDESEVSKSISLNANVRDVGNSSTLPVEISYYLQYYEADSDFSGLCSENNLPPLDAYYMKNDDNNLVPLQFTPLFYELKNSSYLYGVRGGKLYLQTSIKNGEAIEITETVLGDGMKNFRLRKLEKMSRARK